MMADIISYITRPDSASPERKDRREDIAHWNRAEAEQLAAVDGIVLSQDHWDVLIYLRRYYLDHGWPTRPDRLSRELDNAFNERGGSRYLYRLFPAGPLVQGSRIAGLPTPANASNSSFGSVH
jgi:tRNA 2-thiouridine synthesizing protein E